MIDLFTQRESRIVKYQGLGIIIDCLLVCICEHCDERDDNDPLILFENLSHLKSYDSKFK